MWFNRYSVSSKVPDTYLSPNLPPFSRESSLATPSSARFPSSNRSVVEARFRTHFFPSLSLLVFPKDVSKIPHGYSPSLPHAAGIHSCPPLGFSHRGDRRGQHHHMPTLPNGHFCTQQ